MTCDRQRRMLLVLEEVNCGGAELAFFALAQALASYIEVHLALSAQSLDNATIRSLCGTVRNAAVRVHVCDPRLNAGTLSNLHASLRRRPSGAIVELLRTVQPGLILVNLPTVERGQAVADAVEEAIPRVPLWGFLHLPHEPSTIGAKLGAIRDLLVPRLIRRFDRLLTVSHAGARDIARRYGLPEPDVVYPPTAALQPLLPGTDRRRLRTERGLPDTFLLGMIGRMQLNHKGQDAAVRITQRLLSAGHALQLVVVGDGPDFDEIAALATRLNIRSNVSFLGWRNDVDIILPLLDAIVMPSNYEGLPQTAIQAATAGVPVVGYAVDGLKELLPAGFSVPRGDEEGLADAVMAILRGSRGWPHREVAERAKEWCEPDRVARRILRLASASLQHDAAGAEEDLSRQA